MRDARTITDDFTLAAEAGQRDRMPDLRREFLAAARRVDDERIRAALMTTKRLGENHALAYHPRDLDLRTGQPVGGWYEVRSFAPSPIDGARRMTTIGEIHHAVEPNFIARRTSTGLGFGLDTLLEAARWIIDTEEG